MKEVCIVGSGISGISMARMLTDDFSVEILEKKEDAGGLIKCERVDGNLFHRVGGHVFNSRNKKVLEWFWSHFDKENEFLKAKRNAKIKIDDRLIGYPIENYLYQLPADKLKPIVIELLEKIENEKSTTSDYKNFKEFLIGNFGEELFRLYFGPYNSKIWNLDLEEVPLNWLEGKLPMPKLKEVILSNIAKEEEAEMVHSSFYYPKRDGSQFIVNRLSNDINIKCNHPVRKIKVGKDKGLEVNDLDKVYDYLIYCGDVRELCSIIEIEDKELIAALDSVKALKSNGTSNMLCETDDNDLSWLYLPENKFKAHRIIYTGNFSATNNEGTDRKTCVVEFSGKYTKDDMLGELELLPGNLKPLAFNYEPNSYIIHNKGTAQKIKQLKTLLRPYNIFLLGRFAEWEYYNMDKCIEAAMSLKTELQLQE